MIKDIEADRANCVIVKDLSRFGREHIEAGRLILKTFPALDVRFIAITDHFDSLTADASERNIVVPFRNFCNDSYCCDISKKVRSEQYIKRVNGEFIGAFAVYGYKKSPLDKNKLIIDEYAADIVKRIFSWKIIGITANGIANKLNDAGVLSPFAYKEFLGLNYKTSFYEGNRSCWSAMAVTRILINEIYTGVLIQGKSEKVNYKIKKSIVKPEKEWIRVENTHQSIISIIDYDIVQKLLKVDGRAVVSKPFKLNFFMGILFCGDCHEQMVRRSVSYKGKEKIYYICSSKNRGEGCSRHSVEDECLKQLILKEVRKYLGLYIEQNKLFQKNKEIEIDFQSVLQYNKQAIRLKEEQNKYEKLSAGLYEDLEQGVITKNDYNKFYKTYRKYIEDTEELIKKQVIIGGNMFRNGLESKIRLEKLKNTINIENLDRYILVNLISKIEIFENHRVKINWNFRDEVHTMFALNKEVKGEIEYEQNLKT